MESSFAPRSPNVTCFNRTAPSRGCFAGTRVYVYDPSSKKRAKVVAAEDKFTYIYPRPPHAPPRARLGGRRRPLPLNRRDSDKVLMIRRDRARRRGLCAHGHRARSLPGREENPGATRALTSVLSSRRPLGRPQRSVPRPRRPRPAAAVAFRRRPPRPYRQATSSRRSRARGGCTRAGSPSTVATLRSWRARRGSGLTAATGSR